MVMSARKIAREKQRIRQPYYGAASAEARMSIVWSSERRAEGGCLGTRKAMKVVVSCEKPRGAASKQ
jgi:hypothetical protein